MTSPQRILRRGMRPFFGVINESRSFGRVAGDGRSLLRYAADSFAWRVRKMLRAPTGRSERRVLLVEGVRLVYRPTKGDLQSIREVWAGEIYRFPVTICPKAIVDFGANIGAASIWLAKKYDGARIIAVEPSPDNARLLRVNADANGVHLDVIEAAVSSWDGDGFFDAGQEPNVGHLGNSGATVRVVTPETVLAKLPPGTPVDLVKMDIEGAEGDVLSADSDWLRRVNALIIEFHPTLVDYPGLVDMLVARGFVHFPPGSIHKNSTDAFLRDANSDASVAATGHGEASR